MKIKNILFSQINGYKLIGIFLLIWGPLLLYIDYKCSYLDYLYVDYPTYFEYFIAYAVLLIVLSFIPIILGILLIIFNNKKLVKEILVALCVISLFISFNILIITQIGLGPGLGDMKYYKKHLDEINSKKISKAIVSFIIDSNCYDLNDLYDSFNENQIKIKQNDPASVKLLIEALQDEIYYKNESYGPYLDKSQFGRSGYEAWKPRSTKNAVGYRIEISDYTVKCFPVFDESDAVIIIE